MSATMSSRVSGVLVVCAVACALVACGGDAGPRIAEDCEPTWEFDTVEDGYLTVVAVNNPPAIRVNPDTGEAEGFDTEILPRFAEEACLEIRWLPLAGAPAVAAMTEGRADLGSGGWAITAERGEVIGQFEEPVYWNSGAVLAAEEFDSVDDLEGLTIGVEGGSIYQQAIEATFGSDNVRVYQSVEAEISDLSAGRIDAVVSQVIQTTYQAERRGLLDDYHVTRLSPDDEHPDITGMTSSNYPFTKDNVELGEAVQQYIAGLKDSGEFEEIMRGYGLEDENIFGPDALSDDE